MILIIPSAPKCSADSEVHSSLAAPAGDVRAHARKMAKTAPATPPPLVPPPRAPASTPERRARTSVNGVRIPAAEYEYDLAGTSRAKTRFKGMDGVVFDVFDEAACVSGSMAAVIRSKDPSMPADYAYPLSNVQSGVLETVLEYCYFHASTTRAAISDADADEWDDEFASLDPRHLCELASAAYYLDIKALVDLTCKTIAGMISGKSADEIRSTFCIENDMDGDFLGVLPSEWYSSAGGSARGNRFRTRMLTVERQARRLNKVRALRAKAQSGAPAEGEPIATASVEEIMNYIDGGKANGAGKSSGKRRRGKKKRANGDEGHVGENGTPVNGSETTSPPSTPRSRPPGIGATEDCEVKERLDHDTNKGEELVTSPTTPEQKSARPVVSDTAEKPDPEAASACVPPPEPHNPKPAKQRARKKAEKRRAGSTSTPASRASSEEGGVSAASCESKLGDEFDEEALHHMDEEVEAFRRKMIMADNEAHAKKRAILEVKLGEMQRRADEIERQMAVLAKEREAVRDGLARAQIELSNIPPGVSALYTAN